MIMILFLLILFTFLLCEYYIRIISTIQDFFSVFSHKVVDFSIKGYCNSYRNRQ